MAVQELAYEIKQDVDNILLIPLDDFLKKPQSIAQGFTSYNISNHLMASALLLVYNPSSSSKKIDFVWTLQGKQLQGSQFTKFSKQVIHMSEL